MSDENGNPKPEPSVSPKRHHVFLDRPRTPPEPQLIAPPGCDATEEIPILARILRGWTGVFPMPRNDAYAARLAAQRLEEQAAELERLRGLEQTKHGAPDQAFDAPEEGGRELRDIYTSLKLGGRAPELEKYGGIEAAFSDVWHDLAAAGNTRALDLLQLMAWWHLLHQDRTRRWGRELQRLRAIEQDGRGG